MKRIVTTTGRAVIYEEGKPIFTLEVKTNKARRKFVEVKPYEPGLHLGMWLQPAMNDCSESVCKEEAPFVSLQTHLLHWAWVEQLTSFFITIIDASSPAELRKLVATELETSLHCAPETARKEFESIVLETPPPQDMNTRDIPFTGLSAEIMEKFVAKFGHQPPEQTL